MLLILGVPVVGVRVLLGAGMVMMVVLVVALLPLVSVPCGADAVVGLLAAPPAATLLASAPAPLVCGYRRATALALGLVAVVPAPVLLLLQLLQLAVLRWLVQNQRRLLHAHILGRVEVHVRLQVQQENVFLAAAFGTEHIDGFLFFDVDRFPPSYGKSIVCERGGGSQQGVECGREGGCGRCRVDMLRLNVVEEVCGVCSTELAEWTRIRGRSRGRRRW